ncbi:MAG: amino acid ABC transporter permease [Rhodobacteraceae bacterium]|nr:amino acid ABC transporter permease [Paracoccaceae bacterium]
MLTPQHNSKDFPYWLLVVAGIGLYMAYRIYTDELYTQIITVVSKGIWITVFVTIFAFSSASLIGLILAVGSLSNSLILRQISRFYIEIVRGIPILILLIYVSFVGTPMLISGLNWMLEPLGIDPLRTRDISLFWRAVIALTIGYSAFIAEVLRAGIQSVDIGQIEAAKALGLNGWQRFRKIIFPQAIRTILPPLGNDFIALIKDSSLVSVLGVADIAQRGKIYAAGSYEYLETYNIVAFIYLMLTVSLSLMLRRLEAKMRAAPSG